MGFQRVRFMPYEYPIAYGVQIAPISSFSVANGCKAIGNAGVTYTSGSGNEYFGWMDAKSDGARELAIKFVDRFAEIVKLGLGRDWAYAGWLIELINVLEKFPNRLPVLFSEYSNEKPEEMQSLPVRLFNHEDPSDTGDRVVAVPLPPPGECVAH
jgi:hypothetical protein